MAEGPCFAPLDKEEAIRIADEAKEREWDGFKVMRVAQTEDKTVVMYSRPRPYPPQEESD